MALVRGPRIVRNGLVLHLDAAQKTSSIGVGTTQWKDISGNNKITYLYNGPNLNSSFGGIFNFNDNNNQYGTISNIGSLTNFTVEAFARTNKSLTGKVTSIITNQYDLVSNLNFSLGTNNAPSSYNITFGFYNGAWRNVTGFSMALNTWYHLVGTYNGSTIILYVNGILDTQTNYVGTAASGGEIRIARRWDDSAFSLNNFFSGDIAQLKIYNRALSSTEVLRNYNTTKTRFNL